MKIGDQVYLKWEGITKLGSIVEVRAVSQIITKVKNGGRCVTPPHNEYLVKFSNKTTWCSEYELKLYTKEVVKLKI